MIVFWTANSAASRNVRHEVAIAAEDGKLLQVMLEPLATRDLPMGTLADQAAKLMNWRADATDPEWAKLIAAVEEKATPRWLRQKVHGFEVALKGERHRVSEADTKARTLGGSRTRGRRRPRATCAASGTSSRLIAITSETSLAQLRQRLTGNWENWKSFKPKRTSSKGTSTSLTGIGMRLEQSATTSNTGFTCLSRKLVAKWRREKGFKLKGINSRHSPQLLRGNGTRLKLSETEF